MGLDKTKPILTRDDFEVEPFKASNTLLAAQDKSSLPTSKDDVMIDRHQSVYYSVEYALKRLMQNDQFIEAFLSSSKTYVSYAVDRGLSTALSTNVSYDPSISSIYDGYLSNHIETYHSGTTPPYILSAVAQRYLDVDASNFDEHSATSAFQKISPDPDHNTISNDILVEVEFDDSPTVLKPTNYVNVSVANDKTNGKFRQNAVKNISILETLPRLNQCTYIYKRWLSGIKELYIHLPTTYTFYNEGEKEINKNATWICVKINANHFKFNHIYQAYINGQSLPMQIYNDLSSGANYFDDVMLPSMLRTLCTSNNLSSNTHIVFDAYQSQYVLYFVCYGTDEQAIHIFGD